MAELHEVSEELPTTGTRSEIAPGPRLFLTIQLLLMAACGFAEIFCKYALHLGGRYTYPMLQKNETFWDFSLFIDKFRYLHHPAFFTTDPAFMYPAPVAVVYAIFFSYSHPLRLFIAFIIAVFLAGGVMLVRELQRRGVPLTKAAAYISATLLLGYPLWFELKQANIEIVIWVLLILGVWAFFNDKHYSAAACFGLAASMKIYPFVYVGLLISRRRYRAVAFSILVALASTLSSLWFLGPNLRDAWRQTQAAVGQFRAVYMLHFRVGEIGFDHSLFAVYKRFWPHLPPPEILSHVLTIYLAIAAIAGIALYFLKIRTLPPINQVLCLCIAFILLPPVSGDYTLMHLYVPWALLLLLAQQQWTLRRNTPGLTAAFICLAILLAPLSEFIVHGERFGGQIRAVILVALMYIGLTCPFPAANRFEEAETSA